MGGSEQPFLYPPCTPLSQRRVAYPYSNFNPKATTQASYQALQDRGRPRPKQNGPLVQFDQPVNSYMVVSGNTVDYNPKAYDELQARKRAQAESKDGPVVNFNQHPDSWTIIGGRTVKYTPMPINTKSKVTSIRWTQFVLRITEGFLATGLLVCMICFTNMPNVFRWVMRIAPAWDIILTLYAVYHLYRPANARTPASSASYHLFAIFMDIALLPFYIYMSFYARINYVKPATAILRWRSLFHSTKTTTALLLATVIAAAAISVLHLLSAALDLWLIVIFKKIARLPPDANPLEDNLTSRAATRASKHKYKNSEVTLTGDSWSEKKAGFYSGSTLNPEEQHPRRSTASRDVDEADSRKIPFNHSRVKSNNTFSPHNPETARLSHQHFEEARQYNRDLGRHTLSPDPSDAIPWPAQTRQRASRPNSPAMTGREADMTDFSRTASPAMPNAAPRQNAITQAQKQNLLHDNWYVIDDDLSTLASLSEAGGPSSTHAATETATRQAFLDPPQPLRMNPPTPPPRHNIRDFEDIDEYPDPEDDDVSVIASNHPTVIKRRPLAPRVDQGNGAPSLSSLPAVAASSIYSDDSEDNNDAAPGVTWGENHVRAGTPKRKYYGDLAAATRGVLGSVKYKATATTATTKTVGTGGGGGWGGARKNRILSNETVKSNGTVDAAAMDATGMSALGEYGYGRFPSRQYGKDRGGGRVVSRTGVDIVEVAADDSSAVGFGMRGRRDVSGKVAEEGRGGGWWSRRGY